MSHLSRYVQMSTANPTGWRPWQSRLQGLGAFYLPNTYPLPTAGRGPFLLQPGVNARPTVNGGMGRMGDSTTQILGVTVDPTMLALGVVALLGAIYLLGSGKPKRKARRLRKRISKSQQQLRDLQAV